MNPEKINKIQQFLFQRLKKNLQLITHAYKNLQIRITFCDYQRISLENNALNDNYNMLVDNKWLMLNIYAIIFRYKIDIYLMFLLISCLYYTKYEII